MTTNGRRTNAVQGLAGFTLVEMLMVLVVLGILLPVVFLPFINTAKGVGLPAVSVSMGAVTQTVMDEELARIDSFSWPAVAPQPTTTLLNNSTYTSTITETFCDNGAVLATPASTCTNTGATANSFLTIWVVTTGPNGSTLTISTLKAS